jgi:two-component system sensor histidine kinase MprB
MSFQRRVTLSAAVAVAVAVALASALTYVLVRNDLGRHIDRSLGSLATAFARHEHKAAAGDHALPVGAGVPRSYEILLRRFASQPGDPTVVFGLVDDNGVVRPAINRRAPVLPPATDAALASIARAGAGTRTFDVQIHGTQYRVLAEGVSPGYAVLVTHSLAEGNATLAGLRLTLLVLTLGGIALATLLGWFVGRTTLAPVRRLTATVRHVAQTLDLGERIDEERSDELGSLTASFNALLAVLEETVHKLDESARVQRRLVADASHELRTPVTSLRTNIELLDRADELPAGDRARLTADLVEQLEELSALVNDLIELAREPDHLDQREEVRLDVLVSEAIDRARRHAPTVRFEVELEPTLVNGVPSRLDRAVNNLLDNAVKFAGTDAPIEVRLRDGELEVRDHGPGIAADELPHVFDRFFRGARSRALPGSGLGLAIVRQVAELHAGTVSATAAPGGGTIVRMRVPAEAAWGS